MYRRDQHDGERTPADLREPVWPRAVDTWARHGGVTQVFREVAEFQHLVDIINQTGRVENIDRQDTPGQSRVDRARVRDGGDPDLSVRPRLRKRPCPVH